MRTAGPTTIRGPTTIQSANEGRPHTALNPDGSSAQYIPIRPSGAVTRFSDCTGEKRKRNIPLILRRTNRPTDTHGADPPIKPGVAVPKMSEVTENMKRQRTSSLVSGPSH